MTVAEDMLPKQESTSRDAASASAGSSRPFSTASRMDRPPGMHRPQVNVIALGHQLALMQRTAQLCRHLPGEQHVETQTPESSR